MCQSLYWVLGTLLWARQTERLQPLPGEPFRKGVRRADDRRAGPQTRCRGGSPPCLPLLQLLVLVLCGAA